MKFGIAWLVGFTCWILGAAVADVGDPKSCEEGVYGWSLPGAILLLYVVPMVISFVMGYLTKKESP